MDFAMLPSLVTMLGWCLVHFLWQAAAVGVLYAAARPFLHRGNARYLAAMLALVLMAAMPIATAWHEWSVFSQTVDPGGFAVAAITGTAAAATPAVAAQPGWQSTLQAALPWLVLAWSLGVGLLGLRVARQWRGLRAMLRAAERLPEWQARARLFARQLGLRRIVPVLASVRVATPTLVGWVRPAVVLPLAVLARMSPSQIDMILAHELAHLRRFDHVANLFQVVLETLFYYHPVVHWVSRDARNERELCCDAVALRLTGGARRDFVSALAELEELRGTHPALALAASGGVLVERAWFIVGAEPARPHRRVRGSALLAIFAAALIAAVAWIGSSETAWQRRVADIVSSNRAAAALHIVASPPSVTAPIVARPRLLAVPLATISPKVERRRDPSVPLVIEPVSAPALTVPDMAPPTLPMPRVAMSVQSVQADAGPIADTLKPVHAVRPTYPPDALLAGLQARIVVAFTLGADGRPQDLEIVGSRGGPFDAEAMQALAAWRFAPPAVVGRRYRQAFTFVLGGSDSNPASARACLVRTGTHICRPLTDAPAVQGVLQALR